MENLKQKTTFEERISMKEFRIAFNLKQETLAKALNKEQSTISRMEAEDKELNLEEVKELMEKLKLKPEDILSRKGNLVLIGNIFNENEEVNYKRQVSEEELEASKAIISELREEVKELKSQNKKQNEQIQRLFEMLEVKHHTLA
jgi:DNA-binding XRE family transcriptional regulator